MVRQPHYAFATYGSILIVLLNRDGEDWEIGDASVVTWIYDATEITREITSAIPPIYDAYATLTDPGSQHSYIDPSPSFTDALLEPLARSAPGRAWWLGYLDRPADIVFPDAPKVTLYANWSYVLVKAGPAQARDWRTTYWGHPLLPDLIFPEDKSWLVSTLWDDSWTCVGGSAQLVNTLITDPRIDSRRVRLGEDATPPGHQSI